MHSDEENVKVASRVGNGAGIPRTHWDPAPKWGKFPGPVGERGRGGSNPLPEAGAGENSSPSPSPFPRQVKFPVFFPAPRPAVNIKLQLCPLFANLFFII